MAIKFTPKPFATMDALNQPLAPTAQSAMAGFNQPVEPRSVGRPPSGKIRVTMLLKPETVEKFKATGKGWQARMSDILDRNAP